MNPAEKIKGWAESAKQFYNDVRSEMKKVSWPARQEVVGTTIVVVVAVFFFGLYLGLVDLLLDRGLQWVLGYFTRPGGS
jgi:preprotein translocase subunit SecE